MRRCLYSIILLSCVLYSVSCSFGKKTAIKEGCLEGNILRVAVFLQNEDLPQQKMPRRDLETLAVKKAEHRYRAIISALQVNTNTINIPPDVHIMTHSIVLIQKRPHGHLVLVDFTLSEETAKLLQCM